MAGASSDGEMNYWPAFVDVLTTVIMVVTFLLVIMSAAVMTMSKSFVTKMVYQTSGKVQADGSAGDAKDGAKGAEATGQFASASADAALRAAIQQAGGPEVIALARSISNAPRLSVKAPSDEASAETQGVIVSGSTGVFTLDFAPTGTRIDPDSEQRAVEILRASAAAKSAKLEIWSVAPAFGSVSAAERQAYYRALNTRTLLVNAGVPSSSITARLKVGDEADGKHQVIVIAKP